MYGEVPIILRGAAERETLSPEQLERLRQEMVPVAGAQVNVRSVVLPLALGLIAAWYLSGGSKRRSLW